MTTQDNKQDIEEWKDVVGFEGLYWVSDMGRVKSKRCVLKFSKNPQGYYKVCLWREGKGKNRTVHSLVLDAFIRPRPNNKVARHMDGDQHNNEPDNLRWGALSENQQDRKRHGTYQSGETIVWAKLTNQQAEEIRKKHVRNGHITNHVTLAKEYGVSRRAISLIVEGKTYKNAAIKLAKGV